MSDERQAGESIAIVGMAGRFPKARNIDELWRNLCAGVEAISFFTDEELAAAGVDFPKDDPNYVKARGVLEDADHFDAAFFGMNPKEAEITDPQHRVFLECAWEALESAGCDPEQFEGAIGVFAGMSMNTYLAANLRGHPALMASLNPHQIMLANDKDFLPTRVSYKLNLRGPSLNIQTACSTSLVAVCVACQSLLDFQCDLALAGAAAISFPQKQGHYFQEGGIGSPDGHCRAFDAQAAGTVAGEGAGIVVLKRLADALADGDEIYAVIKGFATNNDGANKIGYTAPSVEGQAEVIALAHAMAGVEPESISYVEAHGTGTPLGDPIEIEGLTRAFRASTEAKNFCAVGSVKSNLGHLDTAAGVVGLIKTALALHHRQIPPTLHFESPNPKIDFAVSPFYVNDKLVQWKNGAAPRRAGVSSFGIGGTNAHVVLEEAPPPLHQREPRVVPSDVQASGGCSLSPAEGERVRVRGNVCATTNELPHPSPQYSSLRGERRMIARPAQLLLLSAKTNEALDQATVNLATHLREHPALDLADAAYTLQVGRRAFTHRGMLVCRDLPDAADALQARDPKRVFARATEHENPPVVFQFPGQGAQRVNMGRELYESEPLFREQVDACCEFLKPLLSLDLRTVLYPDLGGSGRQGTDSDTTEMEAGRLMSAAVELTQTALTQPALFVIEYALAKLWLSWRVQPEAMIGHSIGEYVAACLAGVFSLEDVLTLIAARGRLMQQMPAGTMLAVRLPEREVQDLLNGPLSLSAVNAASLCVVSGPSDAVEEFQVQLAGRNVACTPLHTSHAFHSAMMEPMREPFTALVRSVKRNPPQLPFISNVTGTWITAEQATDPAYWARHLRQTVRFADGVGELLKVPERVLLEVGPGQTLCALTKQHPSRMAKTTALASLPRAKDESSELESMLTALGQLWLAGVTVDWKGFHRHEHRRRVRLPTYPFERKRYFVEPARAKAAADFGPAWSATAPERNGCADKNDRVSPSPSVAVGQRDLEISRKQQIAAALRTLLGELSGANLADLSDQATFTELGFESLFLTQASLAIEKKLGVRVTFRELLGEFSSVNTLAARIDEMLPPGREKDLDPSNTELRPNAASVCDNARSTNTLPLTEAQRELWFGSQMSDAASCAFNECRLIHLRGPLQTEALQAALQQLVDRHEALRTTFAPDGDSQQVHPEMALVVPRSDWSGLEAGERAARLDALQVEDARQAFDLVNGPLLRARLLRLGEDDHVLLLTVHHIICDGHALGIVLRELGEFYGATCRSDAPSLAPPAQLSEYVRALLASRENAEAAAAEAFWLKQFADPSPALELPTDHPRPSAWKFEGAREGRSLPATLSQELKRMSAQHGCTMFATLLASYLLLLRRVAGQHDLVVGVPTADRTMEGADKLVGHCLNFLPLRVKVEDGQTFLEHLSGVQKQFLDAFEHQRCTFGSLLQKLNLPRDSSRMPLVSVTFNVERLTEELRFPGLEAELAANAHSFTNFDLSFNVTEINGGLQLDCRFNTSLFTAQTIQRWLGHFQTLLEGAAANPQQTITALPLLAEHERQQILVEWNRTCADYPRDKCLHELFEAQAARTPEVLAAVCGEASLTYQALNQRAEQLARQLRTLDVGPDVPVGLCVERSLELLVGVLGILKAGGAYVPLDPAYPKERLALMLENTRAPVLLTQRALRDDFKFQIPDLNLLCLDESPDALRDAREANPQSAIRNPQSENLAYIIHTSGSTGLPKGVAMPHRALVNLMAWQLGNSRAGAGTRTLQFSSLSFDVSCQEIFSTWCSGGTLVLVDEATRRDAAGLLRFIAAQGIERLFLPFVALQQLAEAATDQMTCPAGLREVITAGEQLQVTPKLAHWFERLPGCVLHNQYGPSESHVVTAFTLGGAPREWPKLPPIGRPIANARVYLLDAHQQPVPIGVPGELYIGGDCLARGYLNRADLTAEKFVPDPFSQETSARLYRTGDLARWLADGNVEFLGRADQQVKIRGYRVELGEIEAVLAQHPAVRECAVIAREDKPGEKRLAAYVAPAAAAPELRRFLEAKLPDYMIPATFTFLDALPLTPSGKLDRRALPAPDAARPEQSEAFAAPGTPTEIALAGIWREVLGLAQVGVQDNFFELGGHSLLMTQVISRVREAFRVELPMRRFFERPNIASLASAIEEILVEEIDRLGEHEARRLVQSAG